MQIAACSLWQHQLNQPYNCLYGMMCEYVEHSRTDIQIICVLYNNYDAVACKNKTSANNN